MTLHECLLMSPIGIFESFIDQATALNLEYIYLKNEYLWIKGNTNIALTAHVDVYKDHDGNVDIVENNGIIVAYKGDERTPLGGDDRCGVHIMYERFQKPVDTIPHMLLFNGEEVGGVGVKKFIHDTATTDNMEITGVDLMISLDSNHSNEFVFYGDNRSADSWVESFGWKNRGYGIFTDIAVICGFYEFPCLNLGVGYQNQHTSEEYIDIEVMEMCKRKLNRMLGEGYTPTDISVEHIEHDIEDYYQRVARYA